MKREIETVAALQSALNRTDGLSDAVVQGLDLTVHESALRRASFAGTVLLGCTLPPLIEARVVETGGLIFPTLPSLPYEPYRPALYDADTLTAGYRRGDPASISESFDGRVYAHYVASQKANHKTPSRIYSTAQGPRSRSSR